MEERKCVAANQAASIPCDMDSIQSRQRGSAKTRAGLEVMVLRCLRRQPISDQDVVDFPYCILEIKLQTLEEPAWVTSLLQSGEKSK